jgi:hypothetical protein
MTSNEVASPALLPHICADSSTIKSLMSCGFLHRTSFLELYYGADNRNRTCTSKTPDPKGSVTSVTEQSFAENKRATNCICRIFAAFFFRRLLSAGAFQSKDRNGLS